MCLVTHKCMYLGSLGIFESGGPQKQKIPTGPFSLNPPLEIWNSLIDNNFSTYIDNYNTYLHLSRFNYLFIFSIRSFN